MAPHKTATPAGLLQEAQPSGQPRWTRGLASRMMSPGQDAFLAVPPLFTLASELDKYAPSSNAKVRARVPCCTASRADRPAPV